MRRAICAILGSSLWPLGLLTFLSLIPGWPEPVCGAANTDSTQTLALSEDSESQKLWHALIAQADARGLPSRFLKRISSDFVTLEFETLHAYAAEYHPGEHRMVLDRGLSFNAAAGTLKPLSAFSSHEIGTLYHELFHAYMDYLSSRPLSEREPGASLLTFAHKQRCRYARVAITPIPQRKMHTELRFLSGSEAWEALNETWAVFVGWAIWVETELRSDLKGADQTARRQEAWLKRLRKADRDGDLRGYYEPEDPVEKTVTRKRYLAPLHRISPQEVRILLEDVLEYPSVQAQRAVAAMTSQTASPDQLACSD